MATNSPRTMFVLRERKVDADNFPKEEFILTKYLRYTFLLSDSKNKYEAHDKFIKNDFDLNKDDPSWEFIDENPEFYEDIRDKRLLLEHPLRNTKTDDHQLNILHVDEVD